jgi:hypothetical protein
VQQLLVSVASVLLHPAAILVAAVAMLCWAALGWRRRRDGRILQELLSLDAAQRRYALERKHRIYPGDMPAVAFLQRRRRRAAWAAGIVAGALLAGIAAAATIHFRHASAARWVLEDEAITAEGSGYRWPVILRNLSRQTVRIESLDLKVLASRPHPSGNAPPAGAALAAGDSRVAVLRPSLEAAPVMEAGARMALAPRQVLRVPLFIAADHAPNEGWSYDVRLEVRWRTGALASTLTRTGHAFRLGWPGVAPSTDSGDSATSAAPAADEAVAIDP